MTKYLWFDEADLFIWLYYSNFWGKIKFGIAYLVCSPVLLLDAVVRACR